MESKMRSNPLKPPHSTRSNTLKSQVQFKPLEGPRKVADDNYTLNLWRQEVFCKLRNNKKHHKTLLRCSSGQSEIVNKKLGCLSSEYGDMWGAELQSWSFVAGDPPSHVEGRRILRLTSLQRKLVGKEGIWGQTWRKNRGMESRVQAGKEFPAGGF